VCAALACPSPAQHVAAAAEPSGRLRAVRIVTGDVFAPEDTRVLTRLVTALHWQTREEVVAREVWVRPGDPVDAALAAELERNLRATGLFAEVAVRVVPTGVDGEVDLDVTTRDRLTLNVGAGASYVGGVTGVRASLGEGNLFGLGDRVALSFAENSDGEYRGGFAWTDRHVLGSWHAATLRASRTDEGESFGFEVRRPFKHLADPREHAFAFGHDESEVDYYRGGDAVAEVPVQRDTVSGEVRWAAGTRTARRWIGIDVVADRADFEPARGPLAAEFRVPGDTRSVYVGPDLGWQWIDGYRKVDGLDTLAYVQDLTLGTSFGVGVGVRWRDEEGVAGALQPEGRVRASWAAEPLADVYVNASASGGGRLDDGDGVGWDASVAARAFVLATASHTFGGSITFDAVEETQDLRRELTLGEDNGLRGYRARVLAGTRRLRSNLEHRWDTGVELATLRLGTVLFFDAGHVGEGGELGRPFTAAGAGLRIGSKPLLGDGVVRIDVAKPLDDVPGERDGFQLSLSVGQVFTFGGSASTLGAR
jgi:hypothetical protein